MAKLGIHAPLVPRYGCEGLKADESIDSASGRRQYCGNSGRHMVDVFRGLRIVYGSIWAA